MHAPAHTNIVSAHTHKCMRARAHTKDEVSNREQGMMHHRDTFHFEWYQQFQVTDPCCAASSLLSRPLQVITCLVHNPPNYTFVFPMKNLENLVVYRSETIFCMYNTLRCYLLWPVLTERVLSNLPRRHTVAMFASVHLGKGFAFKLMLHGWNAIWYIAGFWMFFMLLFGYWFRAFEISACGQEFFDRSRSCPFLALPLCFALLLQPSRHIASSITTCDTNMELNNNF
jgi:hypothetical protein